ncbi:flavocytochrome c [Shewanella sp. WPAGA9]|uniref:flavocytochrome c n=1 Tax=Shewanella sp. ENK2 TaxID=2775245 RepID=UPI0017867325|nr:flavocytochrome c [Shewanella sp. WPAGA9]
MSESKINISRRDSLKKLTALTFVGAASPAIALESPIDSKENIQWDKAIDIAIIGSGFAGLAAAITAVKNGAKSVAIFEKMSVYGGNSAINGGLFAVPESPLQSKENVKDSAKLMVKDQIASGRGVADTTLLEHVAKNANKALQLTLEAGAEYHPYLQQLGGHSKPRSYQTTVNCGAGITQPMLQYARELGVKTYNRHKFNGFIQNEQGDVTGIKLVKGFYFGEDRGQTINVKATRGVIMASGGFAQNIPLRMAQDPTLNAEVGCTNVKGATGDGLLAMLRIGATPIHMAHIQSGPWASPDEGGFGYVSNYSLFNFPHSVAINRATGQRFMNEIADRKTRCDAELTCRDENGNPLPPILVTSYHYSKHHSSLKKVLKYGVGWQFDTLEELANHFNVPISPLKKQIEQYNQYTKSGVDEQFGKIMDLAKNKPIVPPFTAVRLWPKAHYCQGGVQINKRAQVLDSYSGKPIRGLLAAGEVTGGVHGVSRLGSCAIPECLVMGMTAGQTIMEV